MTSLEKNQRKNMQNETPFLKGSQNARETSNYDVIDG
jgi:hypothetical protein